jgi:hypothetical protein
MPTGGKWQ